MRALTIVRRGASERAQILRETFAGEPVELIWDRPTDADRGQEAYWHRILRARPGIPRRLARQSPFQRPLIQWALERWTFAPIVATSCIDLHCAAIVSKAWQCYFLAAPYS